MGNKMPESIAVEMIRRLRNVEFNIEAAATEDYNRVAKRAYNEAAAMLQRELDAIEIQLSDLGYDVSSLTPLSVGREVQKFFGEV